MYQSPALTSWLTTMQSYLVLRPASVTWRLRCVISLIKQEACGSGGALVGKVGSVFASTATQHGGQETTITSFHSTLLHHGMVIVGLPYSYPGLTTMDEISGGTPYGATTLAGGDGSRQPTENELDGARFQGRHVAEIAGRLSRGATEPDPVPQLTGNLAERIGSTVGRL